MKCISNCPGKNLISVVFSISILAYSILVLSSHLCLGFAICLLHLNSLKALLASVILVTCPAHTNFQIRHNLSANLVIEFVVNIRANLIIPQFSQSGAEVYLHDMVPLGAFRHRLSLLFVYLFIICLPILREGYI